MAKLDEDRAHRISDLVRQLEEASDTATRGVARSLMEAILEFHGAGMERILEIVFESGESGRAIIRRLAADSLVSNLLVLHGLHPDDMETRILRALAKSRVTAELLSVSDGTVRVRLTGSGCGTKEAAEALLLEAAPDAAAIIVEEAPPAVGFVPLESIGTVSPRIA